MPRNALFSKQLCDFVGPDSLTFFDLLRIDHTFVKLPVSHWATNDSYKRAKDMVSNLPVVNDAAERALGIATDANVRTAPKSEPQVQALYKVIKGVREKLSKHATSSEVVTKKALRSVVYEWS